MFSNRIATDMIGDIPCLIREIHMALGVNIFRPALALTLTLPDICSHITYPDIKGVGERYVRWCNEYVRDFIKSETYSFGDFAFALRCAVLHSGNTELEDKNGKKYPKVGLKICSRIDNGSYVSADIKSNINNSFLNSYVRLDVRQFCEEICIAVQKFYIDHKDNVDIQKLLKEYELPILIEDEMQRNMDEGRYIFDQTVGSTYPTKLWTNLYNTGIPQNLSDIGLQGRCVSDGYGFAELQWLLAHGILRIDQNIDK